MEQQKIDMFLMNNAKYFDSAVIYDIQDRLKNADDSKWTLLQTMQFKDPTIMLIISLLAGSLGIDRFMLGDTGLGIGKLLTCGGLGIWSIVDWFLIMGATRDKNYQTFVQTFG
jgi:TM2 domain-containing membrane protein YozV